MMKNKKLFSFLRHLHFCHATFRGKFLMMPHGGHYENKIHLLSVDNEY